MRLTFLGTSSGTPSRTRNVSALALQFDQQNTWWLFDCGEGTQHQVMRSPLKLGRLERIFITHLDGDHVFGLPGLLATRSMGDSAEGPLTIYGPPGIKQYVDDAHGITSTHVAYPIHFVEIDPDNAKSTPYSVFSDDNAHVECIELSHRVVSFGYAITEADKPGKLDADRLRESGVPPGPLFSRIKAGETVTLPDGRVINGREFIGPDIPGRKAVICGDSLPCRNAVQLACNADVLVHEATFMDEDRELAALAHHSTALQTAGIAAEANARALILTHFSPRYDSTDNLLMPQLLAEAKSLFPETLLAEDLWSFAITRK